jgi:CubicO group peptidase (beta-lactamase class C family)
MLAEAGALRLDDSIAVHLPDVPERWRPITIRHLLTHSSGLQEYLAVPGLADEAHALGHREMTRLFGERIRLEFAPGETWAYSNTGYLLLGDVIERVAKQSYWEVLRSRILAPAGMLSTRSSEPRADVPSRATGYSWGDGAFERRPPLSENAYAAGSIVSTIDDMVRWAQALQQGRVLSAAASRTMWTPVTIRRGDIAPFAYGFGWVVDRERGRLAVFHSGGTPGFSSALRHYPGERLTVIVLTNRSDRILDHMPLELAAMVEPSLARGEHPDPDRRLTERLAAALRSVLAGTPRRREFTPAMRIFLATASGRGLAEWINSHGPLTSLRYWSSEASGGYRTLRYRARLGEADVWFSFTLTAAGAVARIYSW